MQLLGRERFDPGRRAVVKAVGAVGGAVLAYPVIDTGLRVANAAVKLTEVLSFDSSTTVEVPHLSQRFSLSCESASAEMALAAATGNHQSPISGQYWESDFLLNMPVANSPNRGFWGGVNGYCSINIPDVGGERLPDPPLAALGGPGYGVHAGPMAEVINSRAGQWVSARPDNLDAEELADVLGRGSVALLWFVNSGSPVNRTLADGTVVWKFEHCVTARGVAKSGDKYSFLVNDPLGGVGWWRQDGWQLNSWRNHFGGSSVVITPNQPLIVSRTGDAVRPVEVKDVFVPGKGQPDAGLAQVDMVVKVPTSDGVIGRFFSRRSRYLAE